jgi:excinuclease ABC subunit C
VVHEPTPAPGVSHFGPYLGGLKVRRAASALHRVLPLSYAGVGPTGSERDMARVRGVAAGDRGLLVRSLKAVLDRKPVAVRSLRGELVRRRDRAASSFAFELAARLQSEIEAFDWVVSEQKATVPGSHALDVHGWADGVLVGLEVRDGRLSAWSQGACSEAEARAHVAATPARWMGFVRRNAELAARLTWSGHRS